MLTQALLIFDTLRVSVATVADSILGGVDAADTDRRLVWWGDACLRHAGMELTIENAEAVDWSRAYVVMSNHQSYMDIPALAVALHGRVRFVAKQELFMVPVWGKAMREAGIISIDRQNRQSAIGSLRVAAETIRSGHNIWIAPEGTRSRTGEIGPLKKGGFLLAMETGAPIVPMVVTGTRDAWPKGTNRIERGKHARIRFGPPISVENQTRDELMKAIDAFFRANV